MNWHSEPCANYTWSPFSNSLSLDGHAVTGKASNFSLETSVTSIPQMAGPAGDFGPDSGTAGLSNLLSRKGVGHSVEVAVPGLMRWPGLMKWRLSICHIL